MRWTDIVTGHHKAMDSRQWEGWPTSSRAADSGLTRSPGWPGGYSTSGRVTGDWKTADNLAAAGHDSWNINRWICSRWFISTWKSIRSSGIGLGQNPAQSRYSQDSSSPYCQGARGYAWLSRSMRPCSLEVFPSLLLRPAGNWHHHVQNYFFAIVHLTNWYIVRHSDCGMMLVALVSKMCFSGFWFMNSLPLWVTLIFFCLGIIS